MCLYLEHLGLAVSIYPTDANQEDRLRAGRAQVPGLLGKCPLPKDGSVGVSSDSQDTWTLSSGALGSRIRPESPLMECGHMGKKASLLHQDPISGPGVGMGEAEGASVDLGDHPGCFCVPHAFWIRQNLEVLGRSVVKIYLKKKFVILEKATTDLWLEHDSLNFDGSIDQKGG